MNALDGVIWLGLDWVYAQVEDRYGRIAAFAVTLTLGVATLTGLIAVVVAIL